MQGDEPPKRQPFCGCGVWVFMVVIVVMIAMWTCHVDVVHTRILQADSRVLNLYNPSNMSLGGIFGKDNKIPSHFESNS